MQVVATWPRSAFNCRTEDWHLEGSTPSAGGIFGAGSVIHVENRGWRVTADLTALRPADWRALRAVLDLARGRYGVLRVPVITAAARRDLPGRRTFSGRRTLSGRWLGSPHIGGPSTVDGTATPSPVVAAAAPAGATELLLSVSPFALELSAMFSLTGDRVYRVTGRRGAHVQIEPPLRHAARVGDVAEFHEPWARMRIDLDNASLARMAGPLSRPTAIPLIEAFS